LRLSGLKEGLPIGAEAAIYTIACEARSRCKHCCHRIEPVFARAGQTACKPGSVLALRRWMAIPLGRPLPSASRDRPGRRRGNTAAGCPACRPYLVLLPVGFAVPLPLPVARWALTPPFHPCRPGEPGRRSVFCGTFPGVAPAGRYPAPCLRGARTFLTRAVARPSAAIQPSDPPPD
jgi:hypothetical protein